MPITRQANSNVNEGMSIDSLSPTLRSKNETESELWQALQLFNLYRFVLALGFWSLSKLTTEAPLFRITDPLLFTQITLTYFVISIFFLLVSFFFRRQYTLQANVPIFIDIPMIILIMHTCGGVMSGVGILLVVIVAAHSLLVPGRLSLFSAALASICLILEQTYSFFLNDTSLNIYTQVGLLGSVILISAFFTNILSLRVRRGLEILENQTRQLIASQQLNAHIISAMHEGVVVLDNHKQIRLINTAGRQLLDFQSNKTISYVNDLPQAFQICFQSWQTEGHNNFVQSIHPAKAEIRLVFLPLGQDLPTGTLVFIYDAAKETQRAQDLKLASLGHLTANIAHELRNPLGTVSHAAQLLAESSTLSDDDRNLVSMIKLHSDRMNMVIQNVLSLSGRKQPNNISINLISWLKKFADELSFPSFSKPEITIECESKNITINIDPSQFTQILINLCENGLRYSLQKTGHPTLTLRIVTSTHPPTVFLDIIDQGEGIPDKVQKHIFEPFFTTEKKGSGLGLYIAKELSLMNGLRLDYIPHSSPGCQFRLAIPLGSLPNG